MTMSRQFLSYSVISFVGAAIHYLFQVILARKVSPEIFGEFSYWLAQVSLFTFLPSFFQIRSNLASISPRHIRLGLIVVILITLIYAVFVSQLESHDLIKSLSGVIYILCATLFGFALGAFQAQEKFNSYSVSQLLVGVAKCVLIFILLAWLTVEQMPFVAIALSYVFGAIFLLIRTQQLQPTAASISNTSTVPLSLFLAIVYVYLPQMDLLIVGATQSQEVLADFSFVSLIYKAAFFGLAIVFQFILPKQASGKIQIQFYKPKILVAGITVASVFLAALSGLIMPWILSAIVGQDLMDRAAWMALTVASVATGSFVLFMLQQQTYSRLALPVVVTAVSYAGFSAMMLILKTSVDFYLLSVWSLNLAIIFYLTEKDQSGFRANTVKK